MIFYINIPLGVIAALLTLQYVRSPKYGEKKAASEIDWLGIGLLAVFVGSLQLVLEKGQDEDWFSSPMISFFTASAVLGGFFFIWREWTAKNPVVQLRVLKNSNLRVGTVLSFIMGFGLYGSTFIIPLYTQATLGWSATQAGVLMVPAALMTAFMMPVIAQLMQRGIPQQFLVAAGMLVFFFFCYWGFKIITPDTAKANFFWMLMMRGIGMGLLFIPITALSLSGLKGKQIGEGAAFTGMMRQLGGSFGIAAITTFMATRTMQHRSDLVSHLDVNNPVVTNRVDGMQMHFMSLGVPPNLAQQFAYKALDGGVMKQAMVLSYMDVFWYIGIMFLLCVPFVMLVRSNKKKGEKLDLSNAH